MKLHSVPVNFGLTFINVTSEYHTFVFGGPCTHSQFSSQITISLVCYTPLKLIFTSFTQSLLSSLNTSTIFPTGPLHILFPIPGHFSIGSLLALFLLKFQSSVYMLLLLKFLPWLLYRRYFPHYLLKLHPVSLLISILITICNYVFGFLIVSLITKLSSKIAGTTSVLIINIWLYNSRYLIKTC